MTILIRYLHTDHEQATESVVLERLKEKVINRITEALEWCSVNSNAKIWLTLGNTVSAQTHQIIEILTEHLQDRAMRLTNTDLQGKFLIDLMQEKGLEVIIKVEQSNVEFD